MKIALCMIVRDAAKTIDALLRSVTTHHEGQLAFDSYVFVDTGSVDDTRERIANAFWLNGEMAWPKDGEPAITHLVEAETARVTLARFKWIDDFAAARNYSFDLADADWKFYLDSDDVWPDVKYLRKTLAQIVAASPECNAINVKYDYAPGMLQDVVRGVRTDAGYRWEDELHEHLVPAGRRRVHEKLDPAWAIEHRPADGHHVRSRDRNIRIASAAYEKSTGAKRGRWAFFLGLYAYDQTPVDYALATRYFKEARNLIGPGTNLATMACIWLARLARDAGDLTAALRHAADSVAFGSFLRETHGTLGLISAERGDVGNATMAFKAFLDRPEPELHSMRERAWVDGTLPVAAADFFANRGMVEETRKALALFTFQDDPLLRRFAANASQKATRIVMAEKFRALFDAMLMDAEPLKAMDLLDLAPAAIADQPVIAELRRWLAPRVRHIANFDEYKAVYTNLDPEEYHGIPGAVLGTGRAKAAIQWAKDHAASDRTLHMLSIGSHDCFIEREMLKACPRLHVTVCDISPLTSGTMQAFMDEFPRRVARHVVTDYDTNWPTTTESGEKFDLVTMFEVIEHVSSDWEAVARVRDALADDGTLMLSTPVASRWVEDKWADRVKAPNAYGHVRAFNATDLWLLVSSVSLTGDLVATDNASLFLATLRKSKVLPESSLAIFVPGTPIPFDPLVIHDTHVGGSEEAVIHLSAALSKLGVNVTVYAPMPMREPELHVVDGVRWLPVENFDPDAHGSVLYWRCPQLCAAHARQFSPTVRRFNWLHDTHYGASPEDYEAAAGIIVLSQVHAGTVAEADGFKGPVKLAANGIDVASMPAIDGERGHRVIYASSPDRGLEILLDGWPAIVEAVPDATLDIFYDWSMFAARHPEEHARMLAKVRSLADSAVTLHGGVSHDVLHKAYANAAVWAYPVFPFVEISCISAMKAAALGAWPVYADHGAVPETLDRKGTPVAKPEDFAQAVIDALKNPPSPSEREALARWAREKYDWNAVARTFKKIVEG